MGRLTLCCVASELRLPSLHASQGSGYDWGMTNAERLEAALKEPNPGSAVYSLAVFLRDAGLPQTELLKLFEEARERHAGDTDETCENALLDTMDYIVNWCLPAKRLYPDG